MCFRIAIPSNTVCSAYAEMKWQAWRVLSVIPLKRTVGGELNKLADNVALGRNMAAVHWRSDAEQSLLLGEARCRHTEICIIQVNPTRSRQ
jgi:hypothetical protein